MRGARSRWAWWGACLLAVPAVLAGVAVLGPARPPTGEAREDPGAAEAPPDTVVAALPTLHAPTGTRPTPDLSAARGRLAAALAARSVVFPADSAELTAPAATTVREIAELLAAAPDARVLVEGHVADTPGGPEAAQRLSERRAEVVAATLVAAGVGRERISTVGRGDERPLATVEQSRRVEVSVR